MSKIGPVATGYVLKESLRIFAQRFWLIISINAIIHVPLLMLYDSIYWWETQRLKLADAAGLADEDFPMTEADVYLFVLTLLMVLVTSPLAHAATAFAIDDHYRGIVPDIKTCLSRSFRLTHKLVTSAAWYALAVTAGLILLILPGIYITVLYYLTYQIVALEGVSGRKALKRSSKLLKGNMWTGFYISAILIIFEFGWIIPAEFITVGSVYILLGAVTQTMLSAYTGVVSVVLYFSSRQQPEHLTLPVAQLTPCKNGVLVSNPSG